jgi:hypothetical protein
MAMACLDGKMAFMVQSLSPIRDRWVDGVVDGSEIPKVARSGSKLITKEKKVIVTLLASSLLWLIIYYWMCNTLDNNRIVVVFSVVWIVEQGGAHSLEFVPMTESAHAKTKMECQERQCHDPR